jgi:glutathione S-transferase
MFFEQYSHEPTLAVMRYLRHYVDDPQRHTAQVRALEPKAIQALTAMEKRLQNSLWIAADSCSIADYALYPYTRMAGEAGLELIHFPAIRDWLARFEAQPGFLPVMSDAAEETLTFADYFLSSG